MSKTAAHTQKSQNQWTNEMIESIVMMLSHFFSHDEKEKSIEQVSHVVIDAVCRSGWPGSLLSPPIRASYQAHVTLYAKNLCYDRQESAIREFAHKSVSLLMQLIPPKRIESLEMGKEDPKKLSGRIKTLIEEEKLYSLSPEQLVARVAKRLLQEKQFEKKNYVKVNLPDRDPLRQLLNLPSENAVPIPKQDIKAHLLRLGSSKDSALIDMLRAAAPFAGPTIQNALGDALFKICKPIGYWDKARVVVLAKVPNSSVLYDLNFQKAYIVAKLKTVPGLERVRDIRFKIG